MDKQMKEKKAQKHKRPLDGREGREALESDRDFELSLQTELLGFDPSGEGHLGFDPTTGKYKQPVGPFDGRDDN